MNSTSDTIRTQRKKRIIKRKKVAKKIVWQRETDIPAN